MDVAFGRRDTLDIPGLTDRILYVDPFCFPILSTIITAALNARTEPKCHPSSPPPHLAHAQRPPRRDYRVGSR